jgi:hypothetical protein
MAMTNCPDRVNFNTWLSLGRFAGLFAAPSALPTIQTNPFGSIIMPCSFEGH